MVISASTLQKLKESLRPSHTRANSCKSPITIQGGLKETEVKYPEEMTYLYCLICLWTPNKGMPSSRHAYVPRNHC